MNNNSGVSAMFELHRLLMEAFRKAQEGRGPVCDIVLNVEDDEPTRWQPKPGDIVEDAVYTQLTKEPLCQ